MKEISGIVRQNPIMLKECCVFSVEQENVIYLVVSTGRQAAKDNIFVQQGQRIHIGGSILTDKDIKGVIVVEQAKIKLDKNYENNFRKK